MTAMTAATLDGLSGGRFLLGLGASGPQVAVVNPGGSTLEERIEQLRLLAELAP